MSIHVSNVKDEPDRALMRMSRSIPRERVVTCSRQCPRYGGRSPLLTARQAALPGRLDLKLGKGDFGTMFQPNKEEVTSGSGIRS